MKRYLMIILGSIIAGLSYNIFFAPYDLVPGGLIGLGTLYSNIYNYEPAFYIAIVNIVFLALSKLTLSYKDIKNYLLPCLIIPLTIYISKDISTIIYFEKIDIILIAIFGAAVTGYGYSMIYKEGASIGGLEIIVDIFNKTKISDNKFLSYFLDLIIVIFTSIIYNLEYGIYSAIIIVVITYMSTKAKLGISSNKTFFIITNKESEVKDFLLNDLKYDFTEFNVKGGFTNQKNKIVMTVIDTKDYYKLKEGIALIDNKAFISIIDNYESINKNITISAKNK